MLWPWVFSKESLLLFRYIDFVVLLVIGLAQGVTSGHVCLPSRAVWATASCLAPSAFGRMPKADAGRCNGASRSRWKQSPIVSACSRVEKVGCFQARQGTSTIMTLKDLGMGSQLIRILSVEDHPVFREGLSTILASQSDMILVSQATDAIEALSEFRRHRPDVTLMDVRLPGTNGIDALVSIRGEYPQARIVMLTTSDSDGEIQRAMRAGASGYILKSMPKNELLGVIRTVHAGRRYLPPEVAARLSEHYGEDDLTDRELQVLRLIRDGHRNKQIADRLAIAETTVNFHIKNLVDKLQANDRTHAVTIAVRRGLLEL